LSFFLREPQELSHSLRREIYNLNNTKTLNRTCPEEKKEKKPPKTTVVKIFPKIPISLPPTHCSENRPPNKQRQNRTYRSTSKAEPGYRNNIQEHDYQMTSQGSQEAWA
jgi:hypothetical protein